MLKAHKGVGCFTWSSDAVREKRGQEQDGSETKQQAQLEVIHVGHPIRLIIRTLHRKGAQAESANR